ncbi:MAG: hypothetical protein KIT08_02720 [Anaerolineales bacterium]|nr:MAG: hypothetical protein KIT08_02720 [Anaerolineales bacterium]
MSRVRVYPGASNPSHELSLSDGVLTWGLRLEGGAEGIKESVLTPSGLRLNWVSGFGAWEPGLAQIEQRDWSGGRGAPRFSTQSARRFYDSQDAWTLTPGRIHAAPQWRYASGLRTVAQRLPGDVHWQALIGSQRSLAARFTVGAGGLEAKRARVWLRRVGSPGELALQLHADAAGAPGAVLPGSTHAITQADVSDVVSQLYSFDVSGYSTPLSAGTYHLSLRGAAADNASNHWEIGVHRRAGGGHTSPDGSVWSASKFCTYYRVEDADIARTFVFFELQGVLYAADQRADGSPSRLHLNGERGVATSGAAAALTDTNKNWPVDQWAGAWLRIIAGKGAGQTQRILSNTVSTLEVEAWHLAPDATSEYAIYATPHWQDISPSTGDLIDGTVQDVSVLNGQALLAQGGGVPILRVRFNPAASPPKHEFDDDGSNTADLVHVFQHSELGPQVWRGFTASGEISRAAPTAWLTALNFGTPIKLGADGQPLHKLLDYNSQLWALKANSVWLVERSEHVARHNLGLEAQPHLSPPPALVWQDKLWFGWGSSLLATGASGLADLGPGRGEGLPAGRGGRVAALAPLGAGRLAAALDAGAGVSSVMVLDDEAWHELLRAPQSGTRIRGLHWQHCPGTAPRLWVEMGGDLAYVQMPVHGDNPLEDANMQFQHEGVLVGSTIDMEATLLPKFLTQLSLVSRNLGEGAQVALDYQVDGEIGGSHWRQAGGFYSSPVDTLALNTGQIYAFRPRLRLLSQRADQPATVEATLLEGFARTPQKYQWELRVRLGELQLDGGGGLDPAPAAFLAWLRRVARSAARIRLRSIWSALDDSYVIVEAPSLQRQLSGEGGVAIVRVREG